MALALTVRELVGLIQPVQELLVYLLGTLNNYVVDPAVGVGLYRNCDTVVFKFMFQPKRDHKNFLRLVFLTSKRQGDHGKHMPVIEGNLAFGYFYLDIIIASQEAVLESLIDPGQIRILIKEHEFIKFQHCPSFSAKILPPLYLVSIDLI